MSTLRFQNTLDILFFSFDLILQPGPCEFSSKPKYIFRYQSKNMLPITTDTSNLGWQSGKSVLECNCYMLSNQIACDVTFLVGRSQETIMAHKYVLISRSSVFEASLCSPSVNLEGIVVPDLEPDIFKSLLRYIYSEEADISLKTAATLFHASKKYGISELTEKCRICLFDNIEKHNVCELLQWATTFHCTEIIQKCLNFTETNPEVSLRSERFCQRGKTDIASIISNPDMIIDEIILWDCLIDWAGVQCKKQNLDPSDKKIRQVMGDLIFLVRFKSMTLTQFTEDVSTRNILLDTEKVEIFQHFCGLKTPESAIFSLPARFKGLRICRFRTEGDFKLHASRWQCENRPDAISFKVSYEIAVLGIILYGCRTSDKDSKIVASITDESDIELVTIEKIVKASHPIHHTYDILFDNSFTAARDVFYTIIVKVDGPLSYWGDFGQKHVSAQGIEFTFKNSLKSTNGTDLTEGQIAGVIFKRKNSLRHGVA
ncbi:hypothetical protein ScPMuIL_009515 [Solemya velum]